MPMIAWFKKNWSTLVLVGFMLFGAGLMAYPTFSDWWNSFHQSRAVESYSKAVAALEKEDYDRILTSAEKYNKALSQTGIIWKMSKDQKKEYEKQLDITGNGIMGYIDIPKINIKLPIYHGTEDTVLEVAIGHLAGTSLPIGGKDSHCAVSGHRGLPSARLFTDLDKLAEGDLWTMTVLDHTVTYEVDQIRIVDPNDLSEIMIESGKDYATLVTCTPYGINTHRLLVRGHRVPNVNGEADTATDALQIKPMHVAPFLAVPILIALLIWMLKQTAQSRRRRKLVEVFHKELERIQKSVEKNET